MIDRLKKFIKKNDLLKKEDNILLTVSGGKDSVCMVHLFSKLKFSLTIAHCNFGLRRDESDEDEIFVKKLADNFNIPFLTKRFSTKKYADQKGVSIQMAARDLRYNWFSELGFDKIITAHHQDDAIETFLIKKSRKSSLGSLCGIPLRNGKVVRPLLCFNSKDIELYLEKKKLEWREDSSNISIDYQRNYIRRIVLPEMEKTNPNVRKELIREIVNNKEKYEKLLDEKRRLQKDVLKVSNNFAQFFYLKLLNHSQKKELIYEFLKPFGPFNWPDVFQLLYAQTGKKVFNNKYILLKNRKIILIKNIVNSESKEQFVSKKCKNIYSPIPLRFSIFDRIGFDIAKNKNQAALDFSKLHFPLLLRKWKNGDAFVPFGMKGRKKLSDFMIDEKFSVLEKENTWVLCSNDDIVWVVGHRLDDRYKLVAQTEKVYLVQPLKTTK